MRNAAGHRREIRGRWGESQVTRCHATVVLAIARKSKAGHGRGRVHGRGRRIERARFVWCGRPARLWVGDRASYE